LSDTEDNKVIGGYGIYGFDATNPIPTMSIPESYGWLMNLTTENDEEITYQRIGQCEAPNIKNGIDKYILFANGKELATIYIYVCPFSKINSLKPPEDFKLCSNT
jgi:hypothetical protein